MFYEWVASEVGSVVARMCSQEVQPKQNRKKDRNRGMDRRSHFSIYICTKSRLFARERYLGQLRYFVSDFEN